MKLKKIVCMLLIVALIASIASVLVACKDDEGDTSGFMLPSTSAIMPKRGWTLRLSSPGQRAAPPTFRRESGSSVLIFRSR